MLASGRYFLHAPYDILHHLLGHFHLFPYGLGIDTIIPVKSNDGVGVAVRTADVVAEIRVDRVAFKVPGRLTADVDPAKVPEKLTGTGHRAQARHQQDVETGASYRSHLFLPTIES